MLLRFYHLLFLFFQAFSTVGTPDYIAPEVLLKKGYGTECDWLVSLNDEGLSKNLDNTCLVTLYAMIFLSYQFLCIEVT